MANGTYKCWTTYRCGVCNKFFHNIAWSITCPHCLSTLEFDCGKLGPMPQYSGMSTHWHIQTTGILPIPNQTSIIVSGVV